MCDTIVRPKSLPRNTVSNHCAHSTFVICALIPTWANCAAIISPPRRAYDGGGRCNVVSNPSANPASASIFFANSGLYALVPVRSTYAGLCGAKCVPIGVPYPNIAPSTMACRSMACAKASRTFTLSNGGILLLVDKIVSPSVEPTNTWKRGSASNCGRFSGAGKPTNASTSSAITEAKAAVGSEMNLNVTFSRTACVPQYASLRVSSILSP